MFEPVKEAYGHFMAGFYDSLVPTLPVMKEYTERGLSDSIVWAPTRMVDSVEEMLDNWQRSNKGHPTNPAKIPVIFVAMGRDLVGTGRDYTMQVADSIDVVIPGDERERIFKLRTVAGDIRTQIAIVANQEAVAKSIAAQFGLWLDSPLNRRMTSRHTFAGMETEWPVHIEDPSMTAMDIKTDAKNICILAIDITLKVTIPLFQAPKDGEPSDGRGTGPDDPDGYPVVTSVRGEWPGVASWEVTE